MSTNILPLVVTALVAVAPVRAHEIGTTRVTASFRAGAYEIEVSTDADALSEKLAAFSGVPAPVDAGAAGEVFRKRVKLAFDGVEVRPAISYSSALLLASIRLSGQVPASAEQFTWAYGWTFASYALTVRRAGSDAETTMWLEGGQTSAPFALASAAPPTRLQTAWRYLTLGFTHIVPHGLDHMLFVLGIYLLSGRARSVLWQVSAFTVAHSITLGLSMYGFVTAPAKIVEPLIAISIVYIAVENIFISHLKASRVALVFAFGLLHGMGFAGALQEVGLARSEFVTALLTFNIGVEAGQLAVIGAAFLMFGWRFGERAWYRHRIAVPASVAIACMAVYWTVERLI